MDADRVCTLRSACHGNQPQLPQTDEQRRFWTECLSAKAIALNLLQITGQKKEDGVGTIFEVSPKMLQSCLSKRQKGIFGKPKIPAGGGYEIRTREGVNPTRFPSVRHRPLGESSKAAMNGAIAYVTLIKATRK